MKPCDAYGTTENIKTEQALSALMLRAAVRVKSRERDAVLL